MKFLHCRNDRVYTDFYLCDSNNNIAMASVFIREGATLGAFCSNLQLGTAVFACDGDIKEVNLSKLKHQFLNQEEKVSDKNYIIRFTKIEMGKEYFFHGTIVNKNLLDKGNMFLVTDNDFYSSLYRKLMNNYDLPLLKEWMPYIEARLIKEKCLSKGNTCYSYCQDGKVLAIGDYCFNTNEVEIYTISAAPQLLSSIVSEGLRKKEIVICQKEQQPLNFTNLDTYFANYGHTSVEKLQKAIVPLSEYKPKVDIITLNKKYMPQQATLVNGGVAELNKANYLIVNQGMGCGKTFQSMGIVEKYMIDKYIKQHPAASIKDACKNISYRNIIMCPGHLLEKWKREIEDEIPYVRVTIIDSLSQLIELKKQKGKKPTGKHWYIMSKDFSKLSYSEVPASSRVKYKMAKVVSCTACSTRYYKKDIGKTCECGGSIAETEVYEQKGIVCPECGELSIPCSSKFIEDDDQGDATVRNMALDPIDFRGKSARNSFCGYCGSSMWMPNITNIDEGGEYSKFVEKNSPWRKYKHFTSAAKKGQKVVWMLPKYLKKYIAQHEIVTEGLYEVKKEGVRKVAPERFIKKHLGKGFFDFAIFDEAQDYKDGGSAQGHAMHSVIKASKKHMALTGTIAGGYAEHLFYLLYRLDPKRMIDKGYKYKDSFQFSRDYGVIEEKNLFVNDYEYNSSSRGKQIVRPTCKPGISPLIFPHFLLDRTIFLDLTDLAAFLPKLYEHVAIVDMDDDVSSCYSKMKGIFKNKMKEKGRGKRVMSTMLQTLLSYVDMPSGVSPILDPKDGSPYITPTNVDISNILLPKEEYLVELITKEISEGRNVCVFAEFSGDGEKNVTERLKAIIEEHCNLKGKVQILKSESPGSRQREQWMKTQAIKGMKVMITNPRCVSTGIDFIFKEKGKIYNFPTIVFYQMGTNLFTLWQASCRHYRLIQKQECRTYYLAYRSSLQEQMIRLMAEKKVATAAIQGKFSAEGLAAMAQGVDARLLLAKSLSDSAEVPKEDLVDMFAKINESANDLVLTPEELEYIQSQQQDKAIPTIEGQFDLLDQLEEGKSVIIDNQIGTKRKKVKVDVVQFDLFTELKVITTPPKSKKSPFEGQFSLLNLI